MVPGWLDVRSLRSCHRPHQLDEQPPAVVGASPAVERVRIPLDRRMAMAVTSKRLLLWSVTWRSRNKPAFLGEIPLSDIATAELPYIGKGWRVAHIRFAN